MINNLYGNKLTNKIYEEISKECQNKHFKLANILVGDDYGSLAYEKRMRKVANELSVEVISLRLLKTVSEEKLIDEISKLNEDLTVDGILLQLPLPKGFNTVRVIEAIDYQKDVDGVHPYNLGWLFSGYPKVIPCTPKAVMRLLGEYDIELKGKNVVIVGRSNSVGKPLFSLMSKADATVTLCHSKTRDLFQLTQKADIIVTAIGVANYFDESYFNENSIIIDVGINQGENGICGDVAYHLVADKVQAITPVPKGIGSLTMTMLFENLVEIAKSRRR